MSACFKLLEPEVALELDRLCDKFEDAFRAGKNPQIEDYLRGLDGEVFRAALAMLLELELDLRRERGESTVPLPFFQRFPEHHETVLEAFEAERDTEEVGERDPASMSLTTSRLGRYEFAADKPLGEGTFGKVFKAWDTRLRRNVAIKVPRPDKLDKHLFLREARAISQLKHRNICTVYDVDEDDGRPYMVMELIEGPKLSERLCKERLTASEAVGIVYQVALALEHAHSQGIVHRDLKPANIMLRGGHEPVVLDFGLAKVAAASETLMYANTALGTALYMPPEQATGDWAAVGPASDVYSLGMVLYEALTGELPFSGSAKSVIEQVIERHVPDAASRCPSLPAGLAAVCAKACSKRPKDRYSSMAEFATALRPYLPIDHPDYVQAAPAAAWRTRGRLLAVGSAAVVAAGIVIGVQWRPGNNSESPKEIDTVAAAQDDATHGAVPGTNGNPADAGSAEQPAPRTQPDLPPSLLEPLETPPSPAPAVEPSQADRPVIVPAAPRGEESNTAPAATPSGEPPAAVAVPGDKNQDHADTAAMNRPAEPIGPTEPSTPGADTMKPPAQPPTAQQIEALIEDLAKHATDPEKEVPAEVIQRSIELGLEFWRGGEQQRREFWDAWTTRLRRRGEQPPASEDGGEGENPQMRPATPDAPPALNRPLRRLLIPKPR